MLEFYIWTTLKAYTTWKSYLVVCISYIQQVFFRIVWKSMNKTFVFPATLYILKLNGRNCCKGKYLSIIFSLARMQRPLWWKMKYACYWMTRWFVDLFFLLCIKQTLIFMRKVSFLDEKTCCLYTSKSHLIRYQQKSNIHDTF